MLFLLAGSIVLICISAYEAVRWAEVSLDCAEQRVQHQMLLDSPMCNAVAQGLEWPSQAQRRGHSGTECEQSRRALRLTAMACTIRTFWRGSELYRLYDMMAQSPLTVAATFVLLFYAGIQWWRAGPKGPEGPTELQRQIYVQYHQPPAREQ